ncbi:MAG: hypothetical protein KJ939_05700 [Nanoarchaeota archaeon]|nr:hypothetical protein [Nanoarchaeota archaeon]
MREMKGISKILKWFLGIFGSLFMLVGFMLFFFGLILNNMVSNLDNFEEVTKTTIDTFLEENRPEIRAFMEESLVQTLGSMDFIDKDTIKILCSAPESRFVEGQGALEFQEILTERVCSDLDSKTDDEIKDSIFDALIDQNLDSVLQIVEQTEEVKTALESSKQSYEAAKGFIFGGGIVLYLLGVFLIFWSSSFKWKKGIYTASLQTAIKLLTVAGVFFYIKLLKPESILKLMDGLKEHFAEMNSMNVPPIIVKFAAAVMLDWIRLATNPLIQLSILVAIPFIIIVVVLLIVRSKERKKNNSKELKDEVV